MGGKAPAGDALREVAARGALHQAAAGDALHQAAAAETRRIVESGRRVLRLESESLATLADRIDGSFAAVVRRIRDATGRVVVSGVGKSGVVARKIASTLASTGTPAFFLHPTEGRHGDIGALMQGDLLLIVSRSGESAELEELLEAVRGLDLSVIALTARPGSTLGRHADLVLDVGVRGEACPYDLTPTASSTAALAMGDAIAVAVLELRGVGPEDFAHLHPGGTLGRRLRLKVADVMIRDPVELPRVSPSDDLATAMHAIAHRRGTVPVTDDEGRVVGIITAGDLTRFAGDRPDFLSCLVGEAMNPRPICIGPAEPASSALRACEEKAVMALPVVDGSGRLVGIVHLHDLLRAGVA